MQTQHWRQHQRSFWVIGVPPMGWLLLFFLVPVAGMWLLSFSEKIDIVDTALTWTFANYTRALDPLYLGIFQKSFTIAGITTLLCLIIGFVVALAITFSGPRLKPILLLLVILPFWTNLLIRTYALIAVLRTRGYANFALEDIWQGANSLLTWVGLGSWQLLGERFIALELLYNNTAVVIGLVYVHLPFMVLPLYAALDRLDRSYLEASLDLGASQLQTFARIVVPLALPGIFSGIVITFIPALGSYLTPDLLGGTDSQMIANVIERQFKGANDAPFGAALSFLLMYLTFFFIACRSLLERRRERAYG